MFRGSIENEIEWSVAKNIIRSKWQKWQKHLVYQFNSQHVLWTDWLGFAVVLCLYRVTDKIQFALVVADWKTSGKRFPFSWQDWKKWEKIDGSWKLKSCSRPNWTTNFRIFTFSSHSVEQTREINWIISEKIIKKLDLKAFFIMKLLLISNS